MATEPFEEGEHEPGAPPHHGKGDFFQKHKVEIIAAALGIAVTVYLYIRSKDSASTTHRPLQVPTQATAILRAQQAQQALQAQRALQALQGRWEYRHGLLTSPTLSVSLNMT
jgi:uncharacterized protein HemX